jgi:iron complex outermembrane receptor protein
MKPILLLSLFLLPVLAYTQLTGHIINENNEGVPYASVLIKNTKTGTNTDSLGYFSLNGDQKFPFTLIISSTGYKPEERIIRNGNANNISIQLLALFRRDTIIITARRRREVLQDVPIPISVVGGKQIDETGDFTVDRVKELVPSVQLYSSNPRNTGLNIRGLGSPFGLTNDGLDPGVGFYVDGVYYARPAAATLDFIDIERIEVLRGPQGTLFGKNTTSGAFNITTRKPSFNPGGDFEVSYGNYGYIQAKSSLSGPLSKKLAARLSFSGTQRSGTVKNVSTGKYTNELNNLGFHGQLLYQPSDKTTVTFSGDASRQRPDGYAQVVAGVVQTKRAAYRQFDAIIADLNYKLPSTNPFDRLIDTDVPWRSDNDLGGASVNVDTKVGPGTLTSTTAWRYWNWNPSNDRDFTGLQVLEKSQNPSKHHQWSQEVRYAGDFSSHLSGVIGLFVLGQDLTTNGNEESGKDQWRFVQSTTSALWKTPGLFDGYGALTNSTIKSLSEAAFANVDWKISNALHILPGIRFNYDKKEVTYARTTYGGLQTTDSALIALQQGVYSNQSFATNAIENHVTYQITVAYKANDYINAFATYSTSYKPIGVNVGGLPVINGQTALNLAEVKPEYVKDYEIGVKTTPAADLTLNLTLYNTDITNYQANVQSPQLGVNRGYLANAEKVNVKGVELDANITASRHFTFYGAGTYTEAKYVQFTNAPLQLELTGLTVNGVQKAFEDISGGALPGVSKWAGSLGGEFTTPVAFLGKAGKFFLALDGYYRSSFSSSPTPSAYLNIDGYVLANGRLGFRAANGFSAYIWARNLFNKNYFEQLLPASGNSGQYAAVLGDPRTYGVTFRYSF